ncbi:MAG TPA: 2-dehydropantoate 2-reductase [Pseudolabrys sp.]|nr:2-dehydropantoate 2-reductase [Pseudolabrys sp.]
MKVCVYGAGAIGMTLAARLTRGGAQVSVVARGANLAAIRANGVRMKAPLGDLAAKVEVSDDAAALRPQDAVMVAVKAPALPSIANGLKALIGPQTQVAFVLNGIPWWYTHGETGRLAGRSLPRLDAGNAMLKTVGVERSIGGVIFGGCDVVEPGVVHVENATMRLILGHPDGRQSETLEALAAVLRGDDLKVEVSDHIRRGVWTKLQMVVCSGLIGCLTGQPPKTAYADPGGARIVSSLVEELGAIANALGCATGLTPQAVLKGAQQQTHLPSAAQDIESGSPMMEFDTLFAAPLELARMLDIPAPTLALLVALTKIRAQGTGAYPADA